MPYNVQIHNYYNNRRGGGGDDHTERTPLTVGGTTSTDGTFSTITLDTTLASKTSYQEGSTPMGVGRNAPRPPVYQLGFFIAVALIEGSIQFHYGIWWAVAMNALISATGIATLLAGTTAKTVHGITLWVWGLSAAIGAVLFGIYVVWRGNETIFGWCLAYAYHRYADDELSFWDVCESLETDGTLEILWVGVVVLGIFFGFPFMHMAVRTVHRFYAIADTAALGQAQWR